MSPPCVEFYPLQQGLLGLLRVRIQGRVNSVAEFVADVLEDALGEEVAVFASSAGSVCGDLRGYFMSGSKTSFHLLRGRDLMILNDRKRA